MKIAIHQPNFMPWNPFFEKIRSADVFVILTHCQFEKNNFQNRFNMLDRWNTMSVNKGLEPIQNKKYLEPQRDWNKIKENLKEFRQTLDQFDCLIQENLVQTNVAIIKKICRMLDIETEIVLDYPTNLKGTDRLVDICKTMKSTEYISGPSGKNYLELRKFGDIKVTYHTNVLKRPILEIL
mgnify:FL=1